MKKNDKLLIVQVAALGWDLLEKCGIREINGLDFKPMDTVFPAVTCTAQAAFRTASPPAENGMVANGLFYKDLMRPMFWEQSARLVQGPRIWDAFREAGKSVAMLFWQQSLGESVDMLLSPAPIHKHHGGMIQSCYSKPDDLYRRICRQVGGEFNLMRYWGPRASVKASDWISSATCALLEDSKYAPDLCLTYLPGLDYNLQRHGPDSPQAKADLATVLEQLERLFDVAKGQGYEVLAFGDYAIGPAKEGGTVFPNRALRDAGYFATRTVRGMSYPDFYQSRAFAVVDHEIAHLYVFADKDRGVVAGMMDELEGVAQVLDRDQQREIGVEHPNSGDFLLIADPGHWFAYPWWTLDKAAPDFASHVDIHNKPGYDPCELFFGWPPFSVSRDTDRIKGAHGRIGPDRKCARTATKGFETAADNLVDLAAAVKEWIAG